MAVLNEPAKPRQRAPSLKSLETRQRILDAAELLFAHGGFDGTSIRDIAAEAGVPVALVNFHGGSKQDLYARIVARRADQLSDLRLSALRKLKSRPEPASLSAVLHCFVGPYLERAAKGGPQWLAYARLVAQVSADRKWSDISRRCFDPTARLFIDEIVVFFPGSDRSAVSAGFVFTVSAMLSLATSLWRVDALSDRAGRSDPDAVAGWTGFLVDFAEGGLRRAIAPSGIA